jgi:hypothetical protein
MILMPREFLNGFLQTTAAPSYAILLQVTTCSLYPVQLGTVVPLYIEYHIHIFTNRQLVVQGNRIGGVMFSALVPCEVDRGLISVVFVVSTNHKGVR